MGGDRVRVRLLSAGEQSVNAFANLGSFFSARYAFIPAARLDRLRSLRRRLDQLGDGWAWISEGEQRIQRLREQLPDLIRNLVDSTPLPIERRAPHLIDAAVQIGDDLMGEAESLAGYASDLDERIGGTVSQVLNGLEAFGTKKSNRLRVRSRIYPVGYFHRSECAVRRRAHSTFITLGRL